MKQQFQFTVEADDQNGVPPIVSVRRWLKEGKRRFGVKCMEGREISSRSGLAVAGEAAGDVQADAAAVVG